MLFGVAEGRIMRIAWVLVGVLAVTGVEENGCREWVLWRRLVRVS